MKRTSGLNSVVLIVLVLAAMTGCGSGNNPDDAVANANQTNMQRLSNLYVMYQMKNQFKGPKDEAAFKAFLAKTNGESLDVMGIDPNAIDDLFVCERDGERFVIRYGVPTSTRGSKEPVVFQKTGSDGKRMVGFLNMVQREVENEEYDSLLNAKPVKPKVSRNKRGAGESRSGS